MNIRITTDRKIGYRLAAWGALAAGFAHLLQFLVLGIGGALIEEQFPDPATVGTNLWFGVVSTLTFSAVGLAYLVFLSAATRLTWSQGSESQRVLSAAVSAIGVIGVAGWMLAGAGNLARFGFNATQIADAAGGDAVIGRAALQATYVPIVAGGILSTLALGVWFAVFAIRGLRTGLFGIPTMVATLVAAIVPFLGWALNLGGIPVTIISLFVIGPVLLVKTRAEISGDAHSTALPVDEQAPA